MTEHRVSAEKDHIVQAVACPACGAPKGVGCYTPIDGHDTRWTHDARVYEHMGVKVRG